MDKIVWDENNEVTYGGWQFKRIKRYRELLLRIRRDDSRPWHDICCGSITGSNAENHLANAMVEAVLESLGPIEREKCYA